MLETTLPFNKITASKHVNSFGQFFTSGGQVRIVSESSTSVIHVQIDDAIVSVEAIEKYPDHIKRNPAALRGLLDQSYVRLYKLGDHYRLQITPRGLGGGPGTTTVGILGIAGGIGLFFIPFVGIFLGGTVLGAAISGTIEGATTEEDDWEDFGKKALFGAVTSAVTGGLGAVGGVVAGTAVKAVTAGAQVARVGIQVGFAGVGGVAGTVASTGVEVAMESDVKKRKEIIGRRLNPTNLVVSGVSGLIGSAVGGAGSAITGKVASGFSSVGARTVVGAGLGGASGSLGAVSTKLVSNMIEKKDLDDGLGEAALIGLAIGIPSGAMSGGMTQPKKTAEVPKPIEGGRQKYSGLSGAPEGRTAPAGLTQSKLPGAPTSEVRAVVGADRPRFSGAPIKATPDRAVLGKPVMSKYKPVSSSSRETRHLDHGAKPVSAVRDLRKTASLFFSKDRMAPDSGARLVRNTHLKTTGAHTCMAISNNDPTGWNGDTYDIKPGDTLEQVHDKNEYNAASEGAFAGSSDAEFGGFWQGVTDMWNGATDRYKDLSDKIEASYTTTPSAP